jgi:predicted ATPase
VIEFLKSNAPDKYALLIQTVKAVMPSLLDLQTQYTHTKTLGLFVSEEGIGQPWPAEDVSDGTIQTVALLAAVFDPRTSTVVIEEPENSIHPWAIRQFVDAARKASETKHVILTTHSPVLINQLIPSELWVARRIRSETKLDPVLDLDPTLEKSWGEGQFTLSEYLDSGALPAAVPLEQ